MDRRKRRLFKGNRKNYSLLNQWLLPAGEYATFNEIRKSGGKVNKGAKAYYIAFWKVNVKEIEEENENGEKVTKKVGYPILREYPVFNIDTQTDLYRKWTPEELKKVQGAKEIKDLETIKNDYIKREKLTFEEKRGDKAFYSPSRDLVRVPLKEQFAGDIEYYGTVFHELGHSTGHKDRLDRGFNTVAAFGSKDYSREELVAELTACSILANTGHETIASFKNNAAYIQSWLSALKDDMNMIVWASSRAEKSVNLIMGEGAESPTPSGPENSEKKEEKPANDKEVKKEEKPVKTENKGLSAKQVKTIKGMLSRADNSLQYGFKCSEIGGHMYTDAFKGYFLKGNTLEQMDAIESKTIDANKLFDSGIKTKLNGKEKTINIDTLKAFIKDNKLKVTDKKPRAYVLDDGIGINACWLRDMLEFFKTDKIIVNGFNVVYIEGAEGCGIICPVRLAR